LAVKPVPEGYAALTPYLIVKGAAEALDWYKNALGAEEIMRMPGPDGRLMHAEMRIGNSVVMLSDEFPEMGTNWRSPATVGSITMALWMYIEDCDGLYKRAVEAGAKADQPPATMFWGDRYGRFTDPYGHSWAIATHVEDLSPEEIARRQERFMAKMQEG
jgi:PhnB protein